MAESVLGSDIDVAKEWESLDVMSSLLKPQTGVNVGICTFKRSVHGKGIPSMSATRDERYSLSTASPSDLRKSASSQSCECSCISHWEIWFRLKVSWRE